MSVSRKNTQHGEFVRLLEESADGLKLASQDLQHVRDHIKASISQDGAEFTDIIKAAAGVCGEVFALEHPQFAVLASRLMARGMYRDVASTFSAYFLKTANIYPAREFGELSLRFVRDFAAELDAAIDRRKDELINYNGHVTLQAGYLLTTLTGQIAECPQYLFMREAIGTNITESSFVSSAMTNEILDRVLQCYNALSLHHYTHATPTLYNSCTDSPQLASCFLLSCDDSAESITEVIRDGSLISKHAGGIGISMSDVRAAGSKRKNGGVAAGVIKMIQAMNATVPCWSQSTNRKASWAIYLEPHHAEIVEFLELKRPNTPYEKSARNLFYGLWISDLFMNRAQSGDVWTLFDPATAPGLSAVYDGMPVCSECDYCVNSAYAVWIARTLPSTPLTEGPAVPTPSQHQCSHIWTSRRAYTELYERYERENRGVARILARDLCKYIVDSQRDCGMPYVCFKDTINSSNNQMPLGTIKGSNLCTEIMEYHSAKQYAACTLASINLRSFVREGFTAVDGPNDVAGALAAYDFARLYDITRMVTRSLDNVIKINKFPVSQCDLPADRYRPIGIGVQGLANVFARLRIPFCCGASEALDMKIAETIYFAAMTESTQLASERGRHLHFEATPAAFGMLQFDLWQNVADREIAPPSGGLFSKDYDWDALKQTILRQGLRNSLTTSNMPTNSTKVIFGNNDSFEPFSHNIYTNNLSAAKLLVANYDMIAHLCELKLWTDDIRAKITAAHGSLANIAEIPPAVRDIYLTAREIPQRELMRRTALRGAFIDQAQSLNIFLKDNSSQLIRSVLFAGWKMRLKTGSYYVHTGAAATATRATAANLRGAESTSSVTAAPEDDAEDSPSCRMEAGCISCSS